MSGNAAKYFFFKFVRVIAAHILLTYEQASDLHNTWCTSKLWFCVNHIINYVHNVARNYISGYMILHVDILKVLQSSCCDKCFSGLAISGIRIFPETANEKLENILDLAKTYFQLYFQLHFQNVFSIVFSNVGKKKKGSKVSASDKTMICNRAWLERSTWLNYKIVTYSIHNKVNRLHKLLFKLISTKRLRYPRDLTRMANIIYETFILIIMKCK